MGHRPSYQASIFTTLGLQGFVYLLGVATTITVGRALGRDGLGLYVLANNFLILAGLLTGGGLQFANAYEISRNPRHVASVLLAAGRWLAFVAAVAVLLVASGADKAIVRSALGSGPPEIYASFIVGLVPVYLLHQYLQSAYLGLRRFLPYNAIPLASSGLLIALVVLLVVGWHRGNYGLIVAWLLTHILVATTAAVVTLGLLRGPRSSAVRLQTLLRVGGLALLSNVLAMLVWRVDVFLLNMLSDRTAVGLYGAAVSVAESSLKIPLQLGTVLFPFVASDPTPGAARRAAATSRVVIGASLLLAAALGAGGHAILNLLYGERYLSGYPVLLALLPGMVAWSLLSVLSNYFAGRGYPPVTYLSPVAALSVDVVLNFVLIPRFGSLGTAAAASASYAVWAAILLVKFIRETGLQWTELLILGRSDWRKVTADLRTVVSRIRLRW